MRARGADPPLAAAGSHDSVMGRAGARPIHLRSLRCLPGEDGGHVLSANTVQVQVHLLGAFDPGPRRWEQLSGPYPLRGGYRAPQTGESARAARPSPGGNLLAGVEPGQRRLTRTYRAWRAWCLARRSRYAAAEQSSPAAAAAAHGAGEGAGAGRGWCEAYGRAGHGLCRKRRQGYRHADRAASNTAGRPIRVGPAPAMIAISLDGQTAHVVGVGSLPPAAKLISPGSSVRPPADSTSVNRAAMSSAVYRSP
jgi:hypothetical protein